MEIVMREKTFNDHAIDELAEVNASCTLRLQYGRCKFSDCKSCSLYKQRNNCYESMNDYDRVRLQQRSGERYAILSANPEPYYSADRLFASWFIGFIVTIAFFAALVVMIMCDTLSFIGLVIILSCCVTGLCMTFLNPDWWQTLRNGVWLKKLESMRR